MTLIVEGECNTGRMYGGASVPRDGYCERGTFGCWAKHSVRRSGSKCKRCGTEGGNYTCAESDRMAFTCSNYRGKHDG